MAHVAGFAADLGLYQTMRCPWFKLSSGNFLWGSPLGSGDRGLDELVTKRKWFLLAATVLPVVLIPIILAVHLTSLRPGQEAFFFAFGRLADFSLFACIKAALWYVCSLNF